MKVLVLSDLHLEFYASDPFPEGIPKTDVVVFAGDIETKPKQLGEFFQRFRDRTEAKLIYVLGNHEYYFNYFPRDIKKYREVTKQIKDFYLLEKQTVTINNFTFAGTTLWTNYNNGMDDLIAIQGMEDHNCIKINKLEKAMPYIFRDSHLKSIRFLNQKLKKYKNNLIVVTHHAPSFNSVNKKFVGSLLNSSFCSELSSLILTYEPCLWIHGHMHDRCDYFIGETRIVCNPYGYPREQKLKTFKHLIVEV